VGLGYRHRWGRSSLGLGRRNPSHRPNPNGLPQPIRVRVRGGAAPSAVASPGRRSPWPPALGGSPLYIVPLLSNTIIPFLPNSHLLSRLTYFCEVHSVYTLPGTIYPIYQIHNSSKKKRQPSACRVRVRVRPLGSFVHNISLHFCKRLFPGIN
jgi:hypothetical protein